MSDVTLLIVFHRVRACRHSRFAQIGVLIALLGVMFAPARAAAQTVKPLSKEQKSKLAAIVNDAPPEKVIQDTHYLVSNERHPHRFYKSLKDIGGMYVGVGSEQSYLFSSWARSEVIIHADFDQMVVDVHTVYGIFFRHSKTAKQFIARWDKANNASSRDLIKSEISGSEVQERILLAFRRARLAIHPRLKGLLFRYKNMGIPTFLSDKGIYQWMVDMHREGRVRAVRCDLTADKAMKSIAAASKALAIPVRSLYLSNVEFYFDYDSGLGKNIRRLPSDGQSIVLRTFPIKQKDADYRYFVQPLGDFHRWLDGDVPNFRTMFMRDPGELKDKVWYLKGPS